VFQAELTYPTFLTAQTSGRTNLVLFTSCNFTN